MSKIKKALYTAIESKDLSRTLSVLSDAPELLAEHIAGVTVRVSVQRTCSQNANQYNHWLGDRNALKELNKVSLL